jgi:hypothetical protein
MELPELVRLHDKGGVLSLLRARCELSGASFYVFRVLLRGSRRRRLGMKEVRCGREFQLLLTLEQAKC